MVGCLKNKKKNMKIEEGRRNDDEEEKRRKNSQIEKKLNRIDQEERGA